jgi:thiamine pyrophosphokinase
MPADSMPARCQLTEALRMSIAGAIFDLDGTLVDSQAQWRQAVTGALVRRGLDAPAADCAFADSESLALGEKCAWLHDSLGLAASAKELYEEIAGRMRVAYQREVTALPGAGAFLRELAGAGVRLAIASSTPGPLVDAALAAQGFEGLFDAVVTGEQVARSKEFPDIYLAALEALGTPRERTWVFEDAPYGLRSARAAGLRTVCVFGEGRREGRGSDEDALSATSDVFVHGYAELSLALIDDFAACDPARLRGETRVLVVDGSPLPSSPELVASLAADADYVVAADKGAEALLAAGVAADIFCGDADSVSEEAAEWARARSSAEILFPSEKYDTDLGLALACARHEAARRGTSARVTVTCASGGRPDHALAVVGLLAQNADLSPRIVEDGYECRVLSPDGMASWRIGGREGATFSLVALREGTVASERGFRWELDHRSLGLLADLGISNVVASDAAEVECHAGVVAAYLIG